MDATSQFPDAPLMVDGKELTQILVLGRVHKVLVTNNAIVYTVDDGSASMEVKKFMEQTSDDQDQEMPQIQEGGYIKVIGRIKVFNGKKSIDAYKIKKVDNFDEVSHHLLSIVYVHLATTRPKSAAHAKGIGHAAYPVENPQADSTGFGSAFGVNNLAADGHLTPLQRQIVSLFQQYSHLTEGGAVSDVIFKLRGSGSENDIRNEIQNLCADGYLYSTLDDEHFKITGQ
ncbi:replication factor A protein 2 [Kappamyces sp. JEL0829]|nr:replication factor A protein 2 [Kappamyces sp. JEL0829]